MSASGLTVVKIGGSTLGRHDTSLDDIAALHAEGKRFVVVHGGGATITEWLAKLDVPSNFVRGLRVTDVRALDVGVGEDDQELLATVADQEVVLADRAAEAVSDLGQDLVADLVAVAIVDAFEVIDVDHRHRER